MLIMENTSTESEDDVYSPMVKLPNFTESEAYNIVARFIQKREYDTWQPPSTFINTTEEGIWCNCSIQLPASCSMQCPESGWMECKDAARAKACVTCIRLLVKHGLLDKELRPVEANALTLEFPRTCSGTQRPCLSNTDHVILWHVKYVTKASRSTKVALITPHFACDSFLLAIDDYWLDFVPTSYSWTPELRASIRSFHDSVAEASKMDVHDVYFCSVLSNAQREVKSELEHVLDTQMMANFARCTVDVREQQLNKWFKAQGDTNATALVLHRMSYWYPQVIKIFAAHAHLATLNGTANFGCPLPYLRDTESELDKEIAKSVGASVMEVLISVMTVQDGGDAADASVLEQTVQQRVQHMREFLRSHPCLPAFAELVDAKDRTSLPDTILGIYYRGGGFFQASKFLEWAGENVLKKYDVVLGHYLFGNTDHFFGRTPSYLEFQEIHDGDDVMLKVYYENRFWAEYRRQNAQRQAEERVEHHTPTWKPVRFHPYLKTYISAWMLNPDGEGLALPNKIALWLCGKQCASLTTVKHYMGRTPDYELLQETPDGKLWVKYQDDGWYCYRRYPHGAIGSEQPEDGEQRPLKYSERFKTFLSPYKSQPLANKIVEWERYKSLALLAVPRKRTNAEEIDGKVLHVGKPKGDHIPWSSLCLDSKSTRRFQCFSQLVPGGVVYLEKEEDLEPKALFFSELQKTWISPALSSEDQQVCLPDGVVEWLKKYVQEVIKERPTLELHRKQMSLTPWCGVPSYIKTMTPPKLKLSRVEDILPFAFRNPVLLGEALTHESFNASNYRRLAVLGGPLLELCIALEGEALNPVDYQAVKRYATSPMAYAIAMADSKLATCILCECSELTEGIEAFVNRVKRFRDANPETKAAASLKIWETDAPRVLSDVFKAVAGALFLDSDWAAFLRAIKPFVKKFVLSQLPDDLTILSQHMCLEIKEASIRTISLHQEPRDIREKMRTRIATDRSKVVCLSALDQDIAWRDVCVAVGNVGTHTICRTWATHRELAEHRAASRIRRILEAAPLSILRESTPNSDLEDYFRAIIPCEEEPPRFPCEEDDVVCEPSEIGSKAKKASRTDPNSGSNYCNLCKVRANGETQLEKHLNGKTHRENRQRLGLAHDTPPSKPSKPEAKQPVRDDF